MQKGLKGIGQLKAEPASQPLGGPLLFLFILLLPPQGNKYSVVFDNIEL